MKNVNVLLAVVLCAGLCVLFGLFNRSADESLGWSPNDMYMQSISSGEGASFTSANLSGSNVSNDGVAVSMRNGSFSLRTRARHASSLTPNNPIASSPNNLPSLQGGAGGRLSSSGSLIGHMTSSAEYHSFGGGHSDNMGSAMTGMTNSGNVAANFAYSSPSYGVASSGLSSYSPITLLPGNDGTQVMSAEQALISTSSSASGLFGSAMQNTYGTATYDQTVYGSNGSTPNGVRGKQNAPSSGLGNSWLNWLDNYYGSGMEDDEIRTMDWQDAYNAYLKMLESWNYTMGDPPTWEEFEAWLWGSKDDPYTTNKHGYRYVPIGTVLPLLTLALMYVAYVVVRRRKSLSKQA